MSSVLSRIATTTTTTTTVKATTAAVTRHHRLLRVEGSSAVIDVRSSSASTRRRHLLLPLPLPTPASRRATHVEAMGTDWESMWGAGLNPGDAFDATRVEPAFESLIGTGTLPTGRACVPGCGRGYAVAALASDERHVTGLEVSKTAKAAADAYLSSVNVSADKAQVIVDDFFTHAPETPYDLVYDCTFLCAIDPSRRLEWAQQMRRLIRPGGEIVSLVFPVGDFEGGPPFALSPDVVKDLLEPAGFENVSLTEVPEEQWARGRQEYLYRWRRI